MDERQWQPSVVDIPIRRDDTGDARVDAAETSMAEPAQQPDSTPLTDPRALTILTTEHWGLLSARGLVYNESFARAGMFLTFMSGTFVGLGLLSTATGFSRQFLVVASVALFLDLFVGLATLGRLIDVNREDFRYLQGMNRLRHAYHELAPGIERYFILSIHDDPVGVFAVYNAPGKPSTLWGTIHGLTTTTGMVSHIVAALGGILVGVLVLLGTDSGEGSIAAAVVVYLAGAIGGRFLMARAIERAMREITALYPTPTERDGDGE